MDPGLLLLNGLSLLYTAVVVPVQIFLWDYSDSCNTFPTLYFDVLVDSFFLVNSVLILLANFHWQHTIEFNLPSFLFCKCSHRLRSFASLSLALSTPLRHIVIISKLY
jgi:hypothetical protein